MRPKKTGQELGTEGMQVSVWVDAEFIRKVDVLADKLHISRTRMLRNLMLAGYDDARLLDAFGLFTLFQKVEEMRKGNYETGEQLQPA